MLKRRKMFSPTAKVVYVSVGIGASPGECADATCVSLNVSA
jgi:hypothetical protein